MLQRKTEVPVGNQTAHDQMQPLVTHYLPKLSSRTGALGPASTSPVSTLSYLRYSLMREVCVDQALAAGGESTLVK